MPLLSTVELVQSNTWVFPDILWHLTKIYVPKVFLLTKIKHEYSDILYNPTHFPGPLECRIRQVPLHSLMQDPIEKFPTCLLRNCMIDFHTWSSTNQQHTFLWIFSHPMIYLFIMIISWMSSWEPLVILLKGLLWSIL